MMSMADSRSGTEPSPIVPDVNDKNLGAEFLDSGKIMKVELVNFMCHKNLRINLGSTINFIIGPNGSGKSAILTAISICLGGTSNFTNRANSLKEFLSEGASVGSVAVTLSNRGKDAYKPEVFGDFISIQRQISNDNTSSRRDDVMIICDHMQIYTKNPLVILTQDKSRSFLATSTPIEKYKFFLAGTRLTELNHEYLAIKSSLEIQKSLTKVHEQCLQATDSLQQHLSKLKNMLGWSMVYSQEKRYLEKKEHLSKISARISLLEQGLDEAKKSLDANTLAGKVNQEKMTLLLSRAEPLKSQREESVKNLKALLQKLHLQKTEAKTIASVLETHIKTKEFLSNKLEEEKKDVERIGRLLNDIPDKNYTISDLNTQLKKLHEKRDELVCRESEKTMVYKTLESKLSSLRSGIENDTQELKKHEYKLSELQNRQKNKYYVFGNSMIEAMKIIEEYTKNNKWKKTPPVGPLGSYIKVLNGNFTQLIGELLGSSMNAFAVESQEDLIMLKEIFNKVQCLFKIWRCDSKYVDFSAGEPNKQYTTLIRVIEVSEPILLSQLIVNHHIEKIVITETHTEAIQIVKNGFPKNVSGVFSSDCRSFGNRMGGLATQAMPLSNKPSRFIENLESYIENESREVAMYKERISSKQEALEKDELLLNDCLKEISIIREGLSKTDLNIEEVKTRVSEVDESKFDVRTSAIASLKEAVQAEQNSITNILNQQQKLIQDKAETLNEESIITKDIKQLDTQLLDLRKEHDEVAAAITNLMTEELKLKNELAHRNEQLSKYVQKKASTEKDVAIEKDAYEQEHTKCLELCEKMEVDSTPEKLEAEIKGTECKIKSLESEYGSYENVGLELARKKTAYKQARDELDFMCSFLNDVSKTLAIRTKQWVKFRNYFSSRAKQIYSFLMKNRGYRGRMVLDHDEGTLKLVVETAQNKEPGKYLKRKSRPGAAPEKDPRSLSGGERSFSTICLLIALWEGITCPFRALDEFDVFMDAVNRHQSMQLILDNYRDSARSVQYLFITPQSLSHIRKTGDLDIKVHLLASPERSKS